MRPSSIQLSSLLLCCALAASLAHCADLPLATAPQSTPSALNTNAVQSNSDVIPADIAFTVNAFAETDGSVTLAWEFPPRYYLYRKSLSAQKPDGTALQLELPEGRKISDEFFGESEVYFERLVAHLPAAALNAAPGSTVELQLGYQGCVQDTICYPAQIKTVTLQLPE